MGEQELPKEVIDAILDENGRDIEAARKPFADYDDLKARLEEADKTIEGFKGMDIDAIRREADEWKEKAEQAEQDAETEDEMPAITIYLKRDTNVETERHTLSRTTDVSADKHYIATLSNEAKVVLAKFKK